MKKADEGLIDVEFEDRRPKASWSVEELTTYVKERLGEARRLNQEALGLRRKSAVEVYEAGSALKLIKQKLKLEKTWKSWVAENELKFSTVSEAIRLFEKSTPDEIANLTISQAKRCYGIGTTPGRTKTYTPRVVLQRFQKGVGALERVDWSKGDPDEAVKTLTAVIENLQRRLEELQAATAV